MKVKYSVIIPLYNAEKTIDRCIKSLISQGRDDTEIILVNDGSTDSSLAICEQYKSIYSQIHVINQENSGVSSARNKGLEEAHGEYVLFVDSDDYVDADYFGSIDSVLAEYSYDLVMFAFRKIKNNAVVTERKLRETIAKTRSAAIDVIVETICKKTITNPVAKVYKRKLIFEHQVTFPVGISVAEDRAFNIKYSLYISSYRVSKKCIYNVSLDNEDSLSRQKLKNIEDHFKIADDYIDKAIIESNISGSETKKYEQALQFCRCRSIIKVAKALVKDGVDRKTRLRVIETECDKINKQGSDYPNLLFCKVIALPVKMRWCSIIDLAANYLLK